MTEYVGSLFISMLLLFNFFLLERTLRQELQGKETSGKGFMGNLLYIAPLHHQAVLHLLLIPPLSLHLFLIIIILLFPSPFSSLSSFSRIGRPPRPPCSPAGTCRTGTGVFAYQPCLLLPRFQNYVQNYSQVTKQRQATQRPVSLDSDVQICVILIELEELE